MVGVLKQCRRMVFVSSIDHQNKIEALREKLGELEAEFEHEMRARGFDPAQAENVALPSQLAKLYAQREQIKTKIKELERKINDRDRKNPGSTQTCI
jgi:predicted nuclease with TOPRIM domain